MLIFNAFNLIFTKGCTVYLHLLKGTQSLQGILMPRGFLKKTCYKSLSLLGTPHDFVCRIFVTLIFTMFIDRDDDEDMNKKRADLLKCRDRLLGKRSSRDN